MNDSARKEFFENVIKNNKEVKVFLSNKTMLQGHIKSFDDNSFVIDKCLVFYRQTISIAEI